jgi:hypothetical protein
VVVDVSERNFEEAVEAVLTAQPGEDRESSGDAEYAPGGYCRRRPDDYDRTLCLISDDVFQFLSATPGGKPSSRLGLAEKICRKALRGRNPLPGSLRVQKNFA